jgi:hypothetical protein
MTPRTKLGSCEILSQIGAGGMAAEESEKLPEGNDQLVQQARERMREQIEKCSQRAAQKIAARLKSVSTKPP